MTAEDSVKDCCQEKMVGNITYALVPGLPDTDSHPTSAQDGCIYTVKGDTAGPRYAFAQGHLPVECRSENTNESDDDILFLGPTSFSTQSEVFMVPSFRKPNCRPPPFPSQTVGTSSTSYYSGYFARMTADGPLLCGGELDDAFNEKCFLLNSTGSWTEAPPEQWLPVFRSMPYSYATEFAEGWWIAGNDWDGETILWDGASWKNFEILPKPLKRFCMTKINSTHVFLSGGMVIPTTHSPVTESYIYSRATGFVQIANMGRARHDHACGVHEEKFVIVEGGSSQGYDGISSLYSHQSEIFNLETLTWSAGPYLDYGDERYNHRMVSNGMSTYLIEKRKIWKLVTDESGGENGWEWVTVADLEDQRGQRGVFFMKTQDCQNWKAETNNL